MQFYHLHIINDTERITDPEGQEFPDLKAAGQEAAQVARDLMAQELLHGRALPLGWRVQIADPDDTIRHTIKFTEVAGLVSTGGSNRDPTLAHDLHFRRTASSRRVAMRHAEIHERFRELWQHLQTLSRLNESIKVG